MPDAMPAGDRIPDALEMTAMENVCSDTRAAWLWYCDEHDTHGNADQQDEAEHMASAHIAFFTDDGEPDRDSCEVIVWHRMPHERVVE